MHIGTVRRITSATSQLSNHSFFGYTNLLQNLRKRRGVFVWEVTSKLHLVRVGFRASRLHTG
jgi:hypothetical protein